MTCVRAEEEPPRRIFAETEAQRDARLKWWTDARFGMFIHFGLYSLPARHEWVRGRERIEAEAYDGKYFGRFDPDLFDAKEWARAAKAAGMKYAVLTTKHHEGFCLWDTQTTDYKATKTPFGRDLVREFVDAFRSEGIRIGFYYSVIDWHHPDYLLDETHPTFCREFDKYGDADKPRFMKWLAQENARRDMSKYRDYLFRQVEELLSDYGKVDLVWFDFTPQGSGEPAYGKTWRDWNAVELLKMARRLQPGLIVDNRLDLMETDDGWDFVTPEQFKVQCAPTVRGRKVPWETCQTFSGSWGYSRDETSWKSPAQLVSLLAETVSFGGNLILNVGPTGRGEFDGRAKDRLSAMGRWMRWNARSVYGCGAAPAGFEAPPGTALTYNAQTGRLYIHLLQYPMGFLPTAFFDRIDYAQFLHDGSELKLRPPRQRSKQVGHQDRNYGGIVLPMTKPEVEVPVIEVFLK